MSKSTDIGQDYASLMSEAQTAVSGITDPDLKRIAFERLLDKFLGTANSVPTKTEAASQKKGGKKKGPVEAKNNGPKGRIEQLIEEDFFNTPRSLNDIQNELANRGFHIPSTTLSGPLQKLCQNRRLRRQKQQVGKKETYLYSNW
jgi:hypothetical protein